MKSTSLTKGFVFPLFVVICAILWMILFWSPNRKRILKAKSNITFFENKIKKDIPELQIVAMEKLADSLQTILRQREIRIYPADQLNGLAKSMHTALRKYDLNLVTIRPDYPSLQNLITDSAKTLEMPATVEVSGKFTGFTRLMDELGDLPFAMKVITVDLRRENAESAALIIQLKGIVFLRKTGMNENTNAKPSNAAGGKT